MANGRKPGRSRAPTRNRFPLKGQDFVMRPRPQKLRETETAHPLPSLSLSQISVLSFFQPSRVTHQQFFPYRLAEVSQYLIPVRTGIGITPANTLAEFFGASPDCFP